MTITPPAALGGFQRLVAREPELVNDPRTQLFPQWAREAMRPAAQQGPGGGQGPVAIHATIRALHQAGARMIAGTDSPLVPYGISLHGELEEYVAAGLTPFQAVQTATVNPARLLAVDADLGTVQAGTLADLVASMAIRWSTSRPHGVSGRSSGMGRPTRWRR